MQNNLADVGVANRLYGMTARHMFDVLPTTVVFNPRDLRFVFPKGKYSTPYLKTTLDRHLKSSHLQKDSEINRIVNSYVTDFSVRPESETDKVYLSPAEKAWIEEYTRLVPHYYDTLKETIFAVSKGKDDVFIGNLAVSTYWIRKLNLTNIRVAATVSTQRRLLYMAV